jgi:hypothetical protein
MEVANEQSWSLSGMAHLCVSFNAIHLKGRTSLQKLTNEQHGVPLMEQYSAAMAAGSKG